MAGIVVKPRARILHGHDWVFSSEVLKVFGKPNDGDVISLRDGRDHLIGSAIYNSKSQIVARRFSRRKQDLDFDFFKRRISQAAEYRARRGIDPRRFSLLAFGGAAFLPLLAFAQGSGDGGNEPFDAVFEHVILRARPYRLDRRILANRAGNENEWNLGISRS